MIREHTTQPKDTLWQREALCQYYKPKHWFFEYNRHSPIAFRVCEECPVRRACIKYALDNDEDYGIWGGLSSGERSKMKSLMKRGVPFTEAYWVTVKRRGCSPYHKLRKISPNIISVDQIKVRCECSDPTDSN